MSTSIVELRRLIQESTRIQKGSAIEIDYVDLTHALADATTKQNHVIFGRRGCGKSLLLDKVRKGVGPSIRAIYINCEDYKHHSFKEIDVTADGAKEECRNAPVLEGTTLSNFFTSAPKDAEKALIAEVQVQSEEAQTE